MADELVIVWDCGATNLTVIAVDTKGNLAESVSMANAASPQPGGKKGWLVWDLDALFKKLSDATRAVASKVGADRIKAVTVTTWGADGAPVRADNSLAYAPISWQCMRTEPQVRKVKADVGELKLFKTTGYQVIHFNTLLRLMWLRENAPEALDGAACWVMMPGLFAMKLSGERRMDPTSASTMMAMNLSDRTWSAELLALAGVDETFFPPMANPGEAVGTLTDEAAAATGLRKGTAVIMGGHDTQFAPLGSGAQPGEALLSSGTWEILMMRIKDFKPTDQAFEQGLMYELDAIPGLYQPQLLMMGSGVLEWVRGHLYKDMEDRGKAYETMIGDAEAIDPGADGVTLLPTFVQGTGPAKKYNTLGAINGIQLSTTRGQIYRAALEALSIQLKQAVQVLSDATGHKPKGVRVVGGGSKNRLWNQIRADVTGLPITVTKQVEATVLGAAMAAMAGAGLYGSIDEAMSSIGLGGETIQPDPGRAEAYQEAIGRYERALKGLAT